MPLREDLARKLRNRLHPEKESQIYSVSFLPQRLRLFNGALSISAPPDFRIRYRAAESVSFAGSRSGIALTVMRMPFSIPLHNVTRADLCRYLLPCFPKFHIAKIQRGFTGHSPNITLYLQDAKAARTKNAGETLLLLLIQLRGDTLLLTALRSAKRNAVPDMEAMLQTVMVSPSQCRKTGQ